jgi:cation diffusion facilitator family transporter
MAKRVTPPATQAAAGSEPATMTSNPSPISRGTRTSLLGLLVNAALVGIKLSAGVLGRSQALIADGIESSLDIFSSFVVWRGLRIASVPADADHPYGHGRAESLAGLIVAMMLFVAALGIAAEAIRALNAPRESPAAFTLPVLLGVVAVKETMYRIVQRVARQIGSRAMEVDAWHHRSDAITSGAAAVGISIALIGGPEYAAADNWAALATSVIIAINAYRLSKLPVRELMDTHPRDVVEQVRRIAADVPGVEAVEKVLARKSGLRYWVDMHVEVAPEMSVRDAHELAHGVKDAIRLAMPNIADVLIHIEPYNPTHRP